MSRTLPQKAGYDLPVLLGSSAVKADVYNAPKQVPTIANILKKGRGQIAGVSGGVAINSWVFADKAKTSDKVAAVRTKAAFDKTAGWWRN